MMSAPSLVPGDRRRPDSSAWTRRWLYPPQEVQ